MVGYERSKKNVLNLKFCGKRWSMIFLLGWMVAKIHFFLSE